MTNVRRITLVGVLAALAYLLMLVELRVPGFPIFLKYDLSEVPGLFAAFAVGPVAGVLVEVVKDLIKMLINPGDGGLLGMVINLLAGVSLVGGAGLTRKLLGGRGLWRDAVALVAGTAIMTLVMLVANGFVFFPIYFHMPVAQGWTFALTVSTPFNLVKGVLSSAVAMVLGNVFGRVFAGTALNVNRAS